ncbi:hypothetical protein BH09BAC2_BH09BAC2_23780 [soil metagenome]
MNISTRYLILSVFVLSFAACKKTSNDQNVVPPVVVDTTSAAVKAPLLETFENGIKYNYAASTITLPSGKWSFDNAIIGDQSADKKNGTRSVRIKEAGKITMNFDITGGVYQVVIASAVYSTDAPGTWQLYASVNGGANYVKVGSDITTSSTLKNDTFTVNTAGKIRFSIRKVSGTGQINIDDVEFIKQIIDNDNMLLGNPGNAVTNEAYYTNYLMDKGYYILSYNADQGKPNWVSWHLEASDLGTTARSNTFRPDDALPATWYHVSDNSYTGSGFDRGHNCPSGDRNATSEANSSTFLMTNMMPQAATNNQLTWARLEDSTRKLIETNVNEVYVICGSYGAGGTGLNGYATTIDQGRVTVPAWIWKVVVVLPYGSNDLNRITENTRVIAVITPNNNSLNTNWKTYRTSVDAIEAATGYDLLSKLPVALQQVLEAKVDNL